MRKKKKKKKQEKNVMSASVIRRAAISNAVDFLHQVYLPFKQNHLIILRLT